MRHLFATTSCLCALLARFASTAAETPSITVGTFRQEVRREFTVADGLPANTVTCVAVVGAQTVLAGTTNGLAWVANGRWQTVNGTAGEVVEAVANGHDKPVFVLK